MTTLHQMATKYANENITVNKEQYLSYIDGAGDVIKVILDKIKAKYGYNKPFLYIDLLDTINELFKDEQRAK